MSEHKFKLVQRRSRKSDDHEDVKKYRFYAAIMHGPRLVQCCFGETKTEALKWLGYFCCEHATYYADEAKVFAAANQFLKEKTCKS